MKNPLRKRILVTGGAGFLGSHLCELVILLCGGDNSSQTADIKRAKAFWLEWKRRQT